MARLAGKNGRVYMALTGAGDAEPLPFLAEWSISHSTDKFEVTALEDSNKTYVSGLPDASGEFSGFYDDSTGQTYAAASDGLARKFYLYPDRSTTTKYWYGTILPDFSVSASVGGPITVSASWQAAGPVNRKVT